MIEVYKYLHGKYNVEEVPLLLDDDRVTRGHSRRPKKNRVMSDDETTEEPFPTQDRRQMELPHREVVSAPSLNSFKSKLDELWHAARIQLCPERLLSMRTHREDQLTGF